MSCFPVYRFLPSPNSFPDQAGTSVYRYQVISEYSLVYLVFSLLFIEIFNLNWIKDLISLGPNYNANVTRKNTKLNYTVIDSEKYLKIKH